MCETRLQNATAAQRSASRRRSTGGAAPELRVRDSGNAVPSEVANVLLRAPVRSSTGLGIGLYQATRYAETNGYALTLAENRDDSVCFALRRAG